MEAAPAPMACCLSCGAPLIPTLLFRSAEFYCLECARSFGFLAPVDRKETPELRARYEALKAEWDEHAAPHLRVARVWFEDCEQCAAHREYHSEHASAAEAEADAAARAWLRERAGSGVVS